MPITINSNLASLNAQRRLNESSSLLSRTFTRLSSGLRINTASDDAAGLSIATGLQTDSRIQTQLRRNFNDAISLLNIAESASGELLNIVVRMRELAEQSANGVLSYTQRRALDQEATALRNEYNRITASTKFNGIDLFSEVRGVAAGYLSTDNFNILLNIGTDLARAIGDGTFTESNVNLTTSHNVGDIADMNGDGKADIVANNNGGNTVAIELGNGDGTFRASTTQFTVNGPIEVFARDMNRDGRPDVIVRNNSGFRVLLQNASGGLDAQVVTAASLSNNGDVGDFNGDGIPDVAAIAAGGSAVLIFLGSTGGTFAQAASYAVSGSSERIGAVGDYNNDGKLDFAFRSDAGPASQRLFLGNGDGTFSLGATPLLASEFDAADFDGDGNLDIIGASGVDVVIQYGDGRGGWRSSSQLLSSGLGARGVQATDLNGDGTMDFLALDNVGIVRSYCMSSSGAATVASTSNPLASPLGLFIGDFEGDGVTDYLAGSFTTAALSGHANTTIAPTLEQVNLKSITGARSAMTVLTTAQRRIERERGAIGSQLSRLLTATSVLGTSVENASAAASRLLDADVAEESSRLTRASILQQAGASVLAQANQQPGLALKLLGGL